MWVVLARPAPDAFLRILPAIYSIAFLSLAMQVNGLIGPSGILPLPSGPHPALVCWSGFTLSLGVIILRPYSRPHRAVLVALFALYLYLVNIGQPFLAFQWDYLLLEVGFLAIFLTPAFSRRWLFRWLLFRLMWESGVVKLLSHDLTWRHLTALSFHYETQPLPLPLAWYLHQLPLWFQKASTGFVLVIELAGPFLFFAPQPFRRISAYAVIALQVLILITGNYAFFNLLTIALCLFLFDHRKVSPAPIGTNPYVSFALVILVFTISLTQLALMFDLPVPASLANLSARAAPFGLVNEYGLFATMTTARPEIEIQGSLDGVNWLPYVFRYKVGDPGRAPVLAAPHQPRLDWQMWFAALGDYPRNPWFVHLLERLLEASPPVLALFEHDPFAGHRPKYVRAILFSYRFTGWEERHRTHAWWTRELKGVYFPPVSLKPA